uniref:Uncharacterized protein n=1 Tax=Rhizophora mucronata TaxID=61149 RepID=A0A2P2K5M8_RHIMU
MILLVTGQPLLDLCMVMLPLCPQASLCQWLPMHSTIWSEGSYGATRPSHPILR